MEAQATTRQERKLVAILFADIQGYTAMMQADERIALSRLHRYQTVFSEKVTQYRGEIIKNYGDGSLCLFSSVLDALHCARSIQESLSQEPKVPLRIGLHLGDVTYRAGDVYGNDINIASRIESLGIAGSVLMSGEFLNKVKNQTGYAFQPLGKYHFKNVKEKIAVIALVGEDLAVPSRSQIAEKARKASSSLWRNLALIVSLVLFLAYWFVFRPGLWQNWVGPALTEAERDKRVTISVFENNTGQEDLDNFGVLISDWLTSMLRETGEANVISQENLNLQRAGVGLASIDRLLADRGVGLHIKGKMHVIDDQLVIMPSIIDTETGEVIHTPSHIKGSPSSKEDLLEDLTQNILGYWIVRDKQRYLQKPPRYEAYREYLKGRPLAWGPAGESHFKKAYQLDTTFYTPLLQLIPYYWISRNQDALDSLYTFLQSRQSHFTRWESLIYKFRRAWSDGKALEAASLAIEATNMDPSHYLSFQRAANMYWLKNYPQRAIDLLETADTTAMTDEDVAGIDFLKSMATLLDHEYEKVIALSEKVMASRNLSVGPLAVGEAQTYVDALIYTQQFQKMHAYVQSLDAPPNGHWLYRICNALKVVGEDSLLNRYVEDLRSTARENQQLARENQRSFDYLAQLASAEMFSENWEQAISFFEQYMAKVGVILWWDNFIYGDMSYCYARNGQMSEALALLDQTEIDHPRSFEKARILYYKARLSILENKDEEALNLLSEAVRQGNLFNFETYLFDYKLKPLFDHPRFKELVKPND